MQDHSDIPPIPPTVAHIESPFLAIDKDLNQPVYMGRELRFRFHGKAMEYFGIWIVNILLTIATLSLYAPWAKVRRLRYFYNNTQFFDRFLDFTGVPTKILLGRIIALSIWGIFALAGYMELKIAAFGGLFIYLALPWLIRATVRFNARNSKFGNSRFYFEGTQKEAYKQFFIAALIVIFTLGIFTPVALWLYKRYILNHLYLGQLKFKLNADWPSYMAAVYIPVLMFGAILLVCLTVFLSIASFNDFFELSLFSALITLTYLAALFFIGPLIQAKLFIITWNNTTLSNSQFKTDCNQWRYTWIVATNWILKILSIGMLSAWAAIRLYRYQIDNMILHLQDDPNLMMNIAQKDHHAIAEEISDIFDLDISL